MSAAKLLGRHNASVNVLYSDMHVGSMPYVLTLAEWATRGDHWALDL